MEDRSKGNDGSTQTIATLARASDDITRFTVNDFDKLEAQMASITRVRYCRALFR